MRDRATLYLAELDGHAGGPQAIDVQWAIPPKNLEKSLRAYLENGTDAPFDLVGPLLITCFLCRKQCAMSLVLAADANACC